MKLLGHAGQKLRNSHWNIKYSKHCTGCDVLVKCDCGVYCILYYVYNACMLGSDEVTFAIVLSNNQVVVNPC